MRAGTRAHTHTHTHTHTFNADVMSQRFMEGKQTLKASALKTGNADTHISVYNFLTSRQRAYGDDTMWQHKWSIN
jgi:hypothetical protein